MIYVVYIFTITAYCSASTIYMLVLSDFYDFVRKSFLFLTPMEKYVCLELFFLTLWYLTKVNSVISDSNVTHNIIILVTGKIQLNYCSTWRRILGVRRTNVCMCMTVNYSSRYYVGLEVQRPLNLEPKISIPFYINNGSAFLPLLSSALILFLSTPSKSILILNLTATILNLEYHNF